MQKVQFHTTDNTLLTGDLYGLEPRQSKPAVAIIGPMTYQKEQAPTEYAQRLAKRGFVALAYDSRYRGESGGSPRAWENPDHKVEDLKAAVGLLRGLEGVTADRVSILAICQGSSEALKAAAETEGLHALATVAGHYRDSEGDVEWLGADGLAARRAAGRAARQKFQETGEVDYVKGVDQTDPNVGMPGEFVWVWYQPWADRDQWENRYAVMSDADLLEYESFTSAQSLSVPWLMIHGDQCFLPAAARRHFEVVPESTPKQMVWDDTPHLAYYDQADVIEQTSDRVAGWLQSPGVQQ